MAKVTNLTKRSTFEQRILLNLDINTPGGIGANNTFGVASHTNESESKTFKALQNLEKKGFVTKSPFNKSLWTLTDKGANATKSGATIGALNRAISGQKVQLSNQKRNEKRLVRLVLSTTKAETDARNAARNIPTTEQSMRANIVFNKTASAIKAGVKARADLRNTRAGIVSIENTIKNFGISRNRQTSFRA